MNNFIAKKLLAPELLYPNRKPNAGRVKAIDGLELLRFESKFSEGVLVSGATIEGELLTCVTSGRYECDYDTPFYGVDDYVMVLKGQLKGNLDSKEIMGVADPGNYSSNQQMGNSNNYSTRKRARVAGTNGTVDIFDNNWRDVVYLMVKSLGKTYIKTELGSDTISSTFATSYEDIVLLGWTREGTNFNSENVKLESVQFFRGDIDEETALKVLDEPYHLLEPELAKFYSSNAAGGTTNNLLAEDLESASEVSTPSVGQEHALLANDIESASEVSTPTLTEGVNALLADDIESASEVDTPSVGQEHALLADDIESASEVSTPTFTQIQALLANDVESASEVSTPALAEGDHALLAEDLESASEISTPTVAQVHVLYANDLESASEVTTPTLTGPVTLADLQDQITSLTALVNTLIEFHGLDPDNPHTISRTSRTSTNIDVSITEHANGSVTLQSS